MLKINPLNFFMPKSPKNQVFDSRDIGFHLLNKGKLKKENFFNIIKRNTLSEIRYNWVLSRLNGNYIYNSSKYYLLDIKSKKTFFRGILCGISSKILKQNLIVPHEEVFENRVNKLKKYLKEVKIQAEPVVFATSFSKEINDVVSLSAISEPTLDFNFKNISYSFREINFKDSINKFSKVYIVDGHHRTASFKSFSKESKKEFQLLTFLTDISNVKSGKFTWHVINPSKKIINRVKELRRVISKPDPQSFWVKYQNNYYVFGDSDIGDVLSIYNLEKWIIKCGDKIKHFYQDDIYKINNDLNSIIFNYPRVTFNEIIDTTNKHQIFPQKTTFLEPKMLTGLIISELV